jgi:hypothetical protein
LLPFVIRKFAAGYPLFFIISCLLIETVAERIAASVLGEFPVVEVLVRVRKPHAPLKGFFADAAVEIRRQCARDGSCCT